MMHHHSDGSRTTAWQTRVWPLLGALAVGLLVPGFMHLVHVMGRNIPQDELAPDYAIAFVWALVLGLTITLWPVPKQDRVPLLILWVAKGGVILGFSLFFEAYYSAMDAYYYFLRARELVRWNEFGLGDGTANIINLARLHYRLIPDSYHAMKVTSAMIGLIGVYLFYRAGVSFLGRSDHRILYVLGLFPSILFWSSILGKDPLVFCGIGLYTFGVIGWHRNHRAAYLWAIAAGILIAAFIRIWLAPLLLLPLIVLVFFGLKGVVKRTTLVLFTGAAMWLAVQSFLSKFNLISPEAALEMAGTVTEALSVGGSAQQSQIDFSSPAGIIKFLPIGAFTALFRPLPGEIMNPFGLLAGVESLGLLVLLVMAIWRTRWREVREPLVLWGVVLLLGWAAFYGVISYHNLGGAVRFRLQVLPILLGLLLYLARRRFPARPVSSAT